jgi:hypothetical protein
MLSSGLRANVPSDMNVSVNSESVSTYTTDDFVISDMNMLNSFEPTPNEASYVDCYICICEAMDVIILIWPDGY